MKIYNIKTGRQGTNFFNFHQEVIFKTNIRKLSTPAQRSLQSSHLARITTEQTRSTDYKSALAVMINVLNYVELAGLIKIDFILREYNEYINCQIYNDLLIHKYASKMKNCSLSLLMLCLLIVAPLFSQPLSAQNSNQNSAMDAKVKKFLSDNSRGWHDLNVPTADGQKLYDLIIKGNYKSALEIGTSTGHSGIWIAWALSKTGGKLITVDIDEQRHKTALENFRKAGLSEYIDARLADAHVLVKELKGPFDFVFSDADKDWYKNYFIDIDPKLKVGGCFTAHNIASRGRGYGGQSDFFSYINTLKNYETTLFSEGGGLSISYKKSEK